MNILLYRASVVISLLVLTIVLILFTTCLPVGATFTPLCACSMHQFLIQLTDGLLMRQLLGIGE